jgi:hypothetical protein
MTARVSFDFTGTSALITGGTTGIGHATATLFRDTGAEVTITGKPAAADHDTDMSDIAYHHLRITDHDSVDPSWPIFRCTASDLSGKSLRSWHFCAPSGAAIRVARSSSSTACRTASE